QLVLPCEARNLLDLLSELAVSSRDPSQEDGRVDGVGEQPEDDGSPEEQVLLPIRAHHEIAQHAEDRDGRHEYEVVAPETQPPSYRHQDQEARVRGEETAAGPGLRRKLPPSLLLMSLAAHLAPEARPRQVDAASAPPRIRGRISPIGLRNTASATPSKGVGCALTITTCAPELFAAGTAPAVG